MSSLNQSAFLAINHLSGRNGVLDFLGVFFAEWLPYALVIGFLILIASEHGWRKKIFWFAEGALAVILSRGLVAEIIGVLYHEERPFSFYQLTPLITETGWSFPSGHAAWFFAMAMTVWYLNKKWGGWFFLLAAVNAIARIYVGVHWPLDVVAGAVIGVVCAIVVHAILAANREALYASGVHGSSPTIQP